MLFFAFFLVDMTTSQPRLRLTFVPPCTSIA